MSLTEPPGALFSITLQGRGANREKTARKMGKMSPGLVKNQPRIWAVSLWVPLARSREWHIYLVRKDKVKNWTDWCNLEAYIQNWEWNEKKLEAHKTAYVNSRTFSKLFNSKPEFLAKFERGSGKFGTVNERNEQWTSEIMIPWINTEISMFLSYLRLHLPVKRV